MSHLLEPSSIPMTHGNERALNHGSQHQYLCSYSDLHNHDDAKLYHKTTLVIKDDEKLYLSADMIENFGM